MCALTNAVLFRIQQIVILTKMAIMSFTKNEIGRFNIKNINMKSFEY